MRLTTATTLWQAAMTKYATGHTTATTHTIKTAIEWVRFCLVDCFLAVINGFKYVIYCLLSVLTEFWKEPTKYKKKINQLFASIASKVNK